MVIFTGVPISTGPASGVKLTSVVGLPTLRVAAAEVASGRHVTLAIAQY
jgi:hypothetical protein